MSFEKINLTTVSKFSPNVISARCPHCGNESNFENAGISDIAGSNFIDGTNMGFRIGIRRCPRSACRGQLFFQTLGDSTATYPVQRIDFDASDVPENISKSFDEALSAQANGLHIASAIMVRKTLELVCIDRSAKGDNLSNRIKDLEKQITLPKQLFTAMDNLRLLGNDAAHIESKIFDEIGDDEAKIAIDLTKEILKAIYQLDSIVSRLEKLKSKK